MRQVIDFRREGLRVAGEFVSVRFETNFRGLVSCFLSVAGKLRNGIPLVGVYGGDTRAKTERSREARGASRVAGKAGMENGRVMPGEGWRGARRGLWVERGKWLRGREKFRGKGCDGGRETSRKGVEK